MLYACATLLIMNESKEKRSDPIKKAFRLIVLLLLLVGIIFGYFWYTNLTKRDTQAKALLFDSAAYETMKSSIESERTRCQEFITQQTGNFGNFEYCKGFISWSENLLR